MAQSTQARTKTKAEQEAQQKALRRAEQANILAGVRPLLDTEEQLLAFARARIAGGWRGKLNVGPEAFFAPYANVALTERRFVVQHVHHSSGKPSEMLPHSYAFGTIARVTFTDIETFGGEPACRLILHLENGLYARLRLRGQLNVASARSMAELFDSLTVTRRAVPVPPTQAKCANCHNLLDRDYKFCPFCGTSQNPDARSGLTLATEEEEEKKRREEAENPALQEAPVNVVQETDFAYERGDQPAEFGIALPLPEPALPEPVPQVAEDAFGAAEAGEAEEHSSAVSEHGLTTSEQSYFEQTASEQATGVGTQEFGQEPRLEASGISQAGPEQAAAEDMTPDAFADFDLQLSPEEPMAATSQSIEAEVEFGQYDTQDFPELPFGGEADAGEEGAGSTGPSPEPLNEGANNAGNVVLDDITEAFIPPINEEAPASPADAEITDSPEVNRVPSRDDSSSADARPEHESNSGDHQP